MHEEALLRELRRKVDQLAQANGGGAIVRARVALGALCHLDEPRLRQLWSRAMAGSVAEDATLEVELLPTLDDPRASSVVLRSVTFADTAPAGGASGLQAPPSASSPPRR